MLPYTPQCLGTHINLTSFLLVCVEDTYFDVVFLHKQYLHVHEQPTQTLKIIEPIANDSFIENELQIGTVTLSTIKLPYLQAILIFGLWYILSLWYIRIVHLAIIKNVTV